MFGGYLHQRNFTSCSVFHVRVTIHFEGLSLWT